MLLQLLLTSLRKNIFSKETHDHEIGTTGLEDKEKVAGTTTLTGGPIEGTMIGIIIEAEDEIIEIGITETIEIIGTIGITVTTETIEMFETIVMIAIVIIGTTVTMGEEEREEITTRIMIEGMLLDETPVITTEEIIKSTRSVTLAIIVMTAIMKEGIATETTIVVPTTNLDDREMRTDAVTSQHVSVKSADSLLQMK
jgi:hypothetical protein